MTGTGRVALRSLSALTAMIVGLASAMPAPAADAARVDWQRRIAHAADGVAVDDRGNVYVAARTEWSIDEPSVSILAKYGPAGRRLWTRRWTLTRAWTEGTDVADGPDGSVYLGGIVGREHYEGAAWFIERYTADGTRLWRRVPRGWREGLATRLTSVAVGAGMVVIAGHEFGCCSVAADEGWVRAFSFDGDLLWTHDVDGPGRLARNHEGVADVAVGPGGSIYLTGWVETRRRTDLVDPTDVEILIHKLSPDGRAIWTRVLRDHHGRDVDHGVSIAVEGSELAVAAYRTGGWLLDTGSDAGHAWLGRFSLGGRLRWSRTWGTTARRAAQPEGLSIGPGGTIYVVGARRDPVDGGIDAFARAYTPRGRAVWELSLGSASRLWATDVDVAGRRFAASGDRIGRGGPARIRGGLAWHLHLVT